MTIPTPIYMGCGSAGPCESAKTRGKSRRQDRRLKRRGRLYIRKLRGVFVLRPAGCRQNNWTEVDESFILMICSAKLRSRDAAYEGFTHI